jgi:glycosyltransferase involved in cell wall biosynthesis
MLNVRSAGVLMSLNVEQHQTENNDTDAETKTVIESVLNERSPGIAAIIVARRHSQYLRIQGNKVEVRCALMIKEALASSHKSSLRVCMLAYAFYESDGRVMRYAEALIREGSVVEVVALRRAGQPEEGAVNGVSVFRIQERTKNESGKYSYLARTLRFFFRSMVVVTRRHLKAPYDVIHVHSVPDFEVFAAFIPKLLGARIILDIHDIVPELYASKFKVSPESFAFSALKMVEKMSAGFADHVIIANDLWFNIITARSIAKDKCSSFINYPDLSVFNGGLRTRGVDGKFVIIYPGTLGWHQGLDIAIDALAILKGRAPNIELHIYGEGSVKSELEEQIAALQLAECVFLRSPLPLREIASVMANADLGIVPKRNDAFGGDAFSTKILEFMALGVPVVVADTRIDKHYFDDSLLRFFRAGDAEDLARVILDAYGHREHNKLLAGRALEWVSQRTWEIKKGDYLAIVNKLAGSER